MPRFFTPAFLALPLLLASTSFAQSTPPPTPPVRDPQAVAILQQALAAAGGAAAIGAVQDYTATGTITYFWAGQQVQGAVTLKGRGIGKFRLEATLQSGTRTWAVSNGAGFIKHADGSARNIPYQNAVNFGNLTFPVAHLAAALQDPSTSISYFGLETRNGQQVQHVRLQRTFPTNLDPRGDFTKLTIRDFFIDPVAFQVLSILDMTHPEDSFTISQPHEMGFSNYRAVNGILVPFSVQETSNGQHTYSVQITQISFNSGLQDGDFQQ